MANFHEWVTGTGVLYLKEKCPQIGTLFLSHSTLLGRKIAEKGLALYRDLETFNNNEIAKNNGLTSKYSLEKLCAQNADIFAATSEITSKECDKFLERPIDAILPNGIDDSFLPEVGQYETKKTLARTKLLKVAEAVTNQQQPKDSFLIINSGKYEFRNKGIDVFIEALGKLN